MSDEQATKRQEILKLIQNSREKASSEAEKFRRLDTTLLVSSIVLGALSTALAGSIAVGGEPVANTLNVTSTANAISGWQVICFLVAFLAATSTIAGSVHKALRVAENLASAVTCSSWLKSLELSISLSNADIDSAVEEYKRLLREHSSILA